MHIHKDLDPSNTVCFKRVKIKITVTQDTYIHSRIYFSRNLIYRFSANDHL